MQKIELSALYADLQKFHGSMAAIAVKTGRHRNTVYKHLAGIVKSPDTHIIGIAAAHLSGLKQSLKAAGKIAAKATML